MEMPLTACTRHTPRDSLILEEYLLIQLRNLYFYSAESEQFIFSTLQGQVVIEFINTYIYTSSIWIRLRTILSSYINEMLDVHVYKMLCTGSNIIIYNIDLFFMLFVNIQIWYKTNFIFSLILIMHFDKVSSYLPNFLPFCVFVDLSVKGQMICDHMHLMKLLVLQTAIY